MADGSQNSASIRPDGTVRYTFSGQYTPYVLGNSLSSEEKKTHQVKSDMDSHAANACHDLESRYHRLVAGREASEAFGASVGTLGLATISADLAIQPESVPMEERPGVLIGELSILWGAERGWRLKSLYTQAIDQVHLEFLNKCTEEVKAPAWHEAARVMLMQAGAALAQEAAIEGERFVYDVKRLSAPLLILGGLGIGAICYARTQNSSVFMNFLRQGGQLFRNAW